MLAVICSLQKAPNFICLPPKTIFATTLLINIKVILTKSMPICRGYREDSVVSKFCLFGNSSEFLESFVNFRKIFQLVCDRLICRISCLACFHNISSITFVNGDLQLTKAFSLFQFILPFGSNNPCLQAKFS